MGIVAHPGKISCVAVSYDGRFIFTCGGSDLSVNMWIVNTVAFEPYIRAAESGDERARVEPFLRQLDEGRHGRLHNDFYDFFCYFQLRAQGEDSMEPRVVSGVSFSYRMPAFTHLYSICPSLDSIPVDDIPEIMSAVGLYASVEDFNNMMNEIRYKDFVLTGKLCEVVTMEELIKLYVNHSPFEPLIDADILRAFNVISDR